MKILKTNPISLNNINSVFLYQSKRWSSISSWFSWNMMLAWIVHLSLYLWPFPLHWLFPFSKMLKFFKKTRELEPFPSLDPEFSILPFLLIFIDNIMDKTGYRHLIFIKETIGWVYRGWAGLLRMGHCRHHLFIGSPSVGATQWHMTHT